MIRMKRTKRQYRMHLEIILILLLMTIVVAGINGSEIAVMHYGHFGGLSLTCQRDELIRMESEVLGYSTNRGCNPQPLCSVPYTLAKWYCRGKSTCGGMQVERRPLHKRTCGSEFTNCLRVEYQCIPMSKLTDICSDTIYEAVDGYVSSPDFPEMYPPNKNCTCSLTPATNEHVQIDTAFFLLKSSRPCHDWLRITVDNDDETTRCGYIPEQKRYIGRNVNINFVSDGHDTEMGFWLKFTGTGGGPVKIRCGRYVNTDDTVTPSTKAPRMKTTRRMYKTRFTTKYIREKVTTSTTSSSTGANTQGDDRDDVTREPNNRAGRYSSTAREHAVTEEPNLVSPRGSKGEKRLRGNVEVEEIEPQVYEYESYEDDTRYEGLGEVDFTSREEGNVQILEEEEEDDKKEASEASPKDLTESEVDIGESDDENKLNVIENNEETLGNKLHVVDEFKTPSLDKREREEADKPDEGFLIPMEENNGGRALEPSSPDNNEQQPSDSAYETRRNKDIIDSQDSWTNPDYVDLDADYVENNFEPIHITDPESIEVHHLATEKTLGKMTTALEDIHSTDTPMVHFVHLEETISSKDEIRDISEDISETEDEQIQISSNTDDQREDSVEQLIIQKDPTTDTAIYKDTTVDSEIDYPNSISEDYKPETVLLNVEDERIDNDNEIKAFGDVLDSSLETNENMGTDEQDINGESIIPSPSNIGYDEAILTGDLLGGNKNGFVLNGEEEQPIFQTGTPGPNELPDIPDVHPPEDKDSTGKLLLAPTNFPQTIRDSENFAQSQKPVPSTRPPSSTTPGNVQSITDFPGDDPEPNILQVATPYDWRLSLSKAGYDYEEPETTMNPFTRTTTPDEMLHYVHSGKPFTDKNSIATGEFHPIGDVISLIDEKDLTTTVTTTRTTTPPPEIFTLLGGLTPLIPLNTIGKGFKPLLIPAKKPTTTMAPTTKPTERYYPTGPEDLASLFEETPWRSFGVNTSWIPPMVLGDDSIMPPRVPTTEPPYHKPEAIKSNSKDKDLMWVLIVIAVVLWVVFMTLLVLLIYHRRKRLACLRGNHPPNPQSAMAKSLFVPPLSAPMTPGFRRPCHHNTATQTGASRLASAMSWTSASTTGPLVNHDHHRPHNPSPTTWSYNEDSSRSISPASPTPSDIRAASTQTLLPHTNDRNTCAVQTDISGTLGRFNASARAKTANTNSSTNTRRHAPLPPVPVPQNSPVSNSNIGDANNNDGMEALRHVLPMTYAHTMLRNIPGASGGASSCPSHNPPYAESCTDLTTNNLNQHECYSMHRGPTLQHPFIARNEKSQIYGSLPIDERARVDTPQAQRPRAKTLNVNSRPSQKKKIHRLSGLPPPPPPPDFFFGPETPKSRKSSINSSIRDQTYSTIKPRARPRASSISSQSTIPGVNPDWSTTDFLTQKWDIAQANEPENLFTPYNQRYLGGDYGSKKSAPILCFPPPPPPPTPPPLPTRRPSAGYDEASDEDNERSHPVGCEASDSQRDQTPSHLKRGISSPNVQDLESAIDNLLQGNQDLLKGASAPQLNRGDSPEEKLKGLVPQQAFFFNDKVQPELRRILSKRRFGSEPVQV